jgi:hypothetical protein
MNTGIIYLIQPCELVGTSRYKIGCSTKNNLDRCHKGYKKGSRYLCIMECNKPLILEQNIKNNFNNKFKLIGGKEYFEGNENDIINEFCNIVYNYRNNYNLIAKDTISEDTIKNIKDILLENLVEIKYAISEDLVEIKNTISKDLVEIKDTISEDQDEIKIIDTYEDYMKFSKIHKIVITDKKTKKGYLKYINSSWRELHDDTIETLHDDTIETLSGYINESSNHDEYCCKLLLQPIEYKKRDINTKNYYLYKNINTNNIINAIEYNKLILQEQELYNFYKQLYTIVELNFDYEKIINDIINKCYIKNPIYYELKYHEHILSNSSFGHYVFDSITKSLTNFNDLDIIKELVRYPTIFNMVLSNESLNNVNIKIIDKIFNQLINNHCKNIGNEYFNGDKYKMIDDIYQLIITNENNNENTYDEQINDEIYNIETLNDYLKFSNSDINKIIITNKKTNEGYIKFSETLWINLYDIKLDSEHLLGFLKRFNTYACIKINTLPIKYCNIKEKYNNLSCELIKLNYNYDKIINDIIKNCYIKNPSIYNFSYCEHILNPDNKLNLTDPNTYYIYNAKTKQITNINDIDEIIDEKNYFRQYSIGSIIDINNIDTNIVNIILNKIIKKKYYKKILEYKKICYNVFVNQSTDITIFYDNNNTKYYGLFTYWLSNAYERICGYSCLTDSNYLEYNKIARFGVISSSTNDHIKLINEYKKLGIKNIIVCTNDTNTMYNNEQESLLYCKKTCNNLDYLDELFYSPSLLFINYFLWCCS